MSRIKLFARRRLFSTNEGGMTLRTVICRDCGYRLETAESTQAILCPNCGGRRFDVSIFPESHEEAPEKVVSGVPRKFLFRDYDSPYERILKKFSGQELSKEEFEKTFSDKANDLLDKNFAEINGDTVKVSENAYGAEKMFSKLIISVTKTLVLEPEVVDGSLDKEIVLRKLADRGIPAEGIACLRKAHCMEPEPERSRLFCNDAEGETTDQWLEGSHIIEDLENEYNNQSFPVDQFVKIINERYPDAPEGILDMLIDKGVLIMNGTTVSVHKN